MTFLNNPMLTTEEVAEKLLGCLLISQHGETKTSGWIVETEAYVGVIDEACHSFEGKRTPRLESMYKEAGTLYVYQMHTHKMLNVVTRSSKEPEAVLIRAIEPFEGVSVLEDRRNKTGVQATDGPGKLTKAMAVSMADNGSVADAPPVYIDPSTRRLPERIELSSRIGIPNKGQWTDALLRYSVRGNPYVSCRKGKPAYNNGWCPVLD